MSQITTGIRSILSRPAVYDLLQWMLGGDKARRRCCEDYIKLNSGNNIVDVGCGTATLLDHLPADVNYYGYDMSEQYIAAAQKKYSSRKLAQFRCSNIDTITEKDLPPCHYAIAMGVLHHLDDNVAKHLMDTVFDRLSHGGILITLDPVYVPGQSRIAYEIIRRDRGQNVRTPDGYLRLLSNKYENCKIEIRTDYFHIPYTLGIMTARKS